MNMVPLTTCRSCGSSELVTFLSLGSTPLANSLLSCDQLEQSEPRYPLDVAYCENCALVQLLGTVSAEVLFRNYIYFSSFSDTMLAHASELVGDVVTARRLDANSLVVEIASNDGYLLQYYRQHQIPVLGIEPAVNVADVAESERGIPTIREFFGEHLARRLAEDNRRADVVHAHNVLAHVADLNDVVSGLAVLMKDEGIAIIEVPYLRDLIEECEFDTIYHEHLCYFSVTSLETLFARHGLSIISVARVSIHGGSLRLQVAHSRSAHGDDSVQAILDEELAWGVADSGRYKSFGSKVEALRDSLLNLLGSLKNDGRSIAGYGAAAKGSTLLNYLGIGRETLDFVADRSTHKQGRYTPGTHIPICPPSRIRELMPDYVLILAWNFAEEIMQQLREYKEGGGKYILPLPEPRIT
jgi:SAM-dependent methyltransferase